MTLLYLIGAVALAGVVWLGFGVWRIGAVSWGPQIPDRAGTALVLIDLQTVFWDEGPYADADKAAALAVIQREAQTARDQGWPVIALRQEWSIPSTRAVARLTMGGQALAGTAGTDLAHPFADMADHVLVKRVQDGFETGALDSLLHKLEAGHLRLVGLDLNYCVLKTALAARNRGFDVTVVQDGTLASASTAQAQNQLRKAGVTLANQS